MRVAIDATPLLVRSAGVKSYLYYWIDHIRRAAQDDEILTVPPLPRLYRLTHDRSIAGRLRTAAGLAALGLSNYCRLPSLAWMVRGAAVFHASNLVRNPPKKARLTATVYDMTTYLMPELHSEANREAGRYFRELAHKAHRLIAISEATRDDTVRVLRIAPEKISVIYPGIAPAFFSPDPEAVASLRLRYRLLRPYVLFVGTIEPRKNVDALADAWKMLPGSIREEYDLALAGPIGWAPAATVARVRQHAYLGYVPESDLPVLTAGAEVLAYPSLYEGFGFPVAQAMAAGVPVITSNISSLPEVTGDAALLVDPRSTTELRDALCRLLLSPALRARLAAQGREQANRFRWERSAEQSLAFFRTVLAE